MGGLRICLDPGHSVNYNKGKDPGPPQYYESNRVFELAYYLKAELEKYKDVVVFMTKAKLEDNPSLWDRGYMAVKNNCDVFESIHTNAFDNSGSAKGVSTHISIYRPDKSLYDKMGNAVTALMKADTGVTYYRGSSTRLYPDRKDWDYYGVVRAAMNYYGKSGVKHAFICEHGFHDNPTECKWLNNSENLKRLAKVKAQVYAEYFGLVLKGEPTPTPTPVPTPTPTGVKDGDLVSINPNSTYYNGGKIPDWVMKDQWYISLPKGSNRAVLGQNKSKTNNIQSPINIKNLTVVSATPTPTFKAYLVKVTADALNIRSGPGTQHSITGVIKDKGTYTIVDTQGTWGKLKSGAGWISLNFTDVAASPIRLNDVVNFLGGKYYVSASGGSNYVGKAGKARVTQIVKGAKYPYHVIRIDKSTTVYGWVAEALVRK